MNPEMDLQEQTRMQDTRNQLNHMITLFDDMTVGLPMVWLWTWDTIKNYYNDSDMTVVDEETVFAALWHRCRSNGFSLEYGAEQHEEEVRDWMLESGLMKINWDEEEEEDEDE